MLENTPIVCFANDFDSDPTSKTHIMRILARSNPILWVNSIGMRRPTASVGDVRRMVSKLRRSLGGCSQAGPNLLVANPLAIPFPGVVLADRLNAEILAAWLRSLCRRHHRDRPVLWTFLPTVARLLGRLRERLVIYHCVDEYSEFTGVARETLRRMEEEVVRRADLVIASSERLRDERRLLNPNSHFVSHGVDLEHFARALDRGTQVPEDVRRLPRPVIGFFGLLEDWVDLELIRDLALSRPQWSFALLGKGVTSLSPLQGVGNVHLLGRKPYAELPGYCRGFDVGIIPFRLNALTARANPLKLREYLAAGLPVVSTPLPEVSRYASLVRMAQGEEAFVAGIEQCLEERSETLARRRVEAMRAESWEARVADISALIDRRLGEAA